MNGDVVGINSSIRTSSSSSAAEGGSIGLGFAIPIDEVMPIIEQIRSGETPTHARLGISVSDVRSESGAVSAEGAQVQEVTERLDRRRPSGLEVGDVITRIDDTAITGADSLVATVRSYRPGDEVTVTYTRETAEVQRRPRSSSTPTPPTGVSELAVLLRGHEIGTPAIDRAQRTRCTRPSSHTGPSDS